MNQILKTMVIEIDDYDGALIDKSTYNLWCQNCIHLQHDCSSLTPVREYFCSHPNCDFSDDINNNIRHDLYLANSCDFYEEYP